MDEIYWYAKPISRLQELRYKVRKQELDEFFARIKEGVKDETKNEV